MASTAGGQSPLLRQFPHLIIRSKLGSVKSAASKLPSELFGTLARKYFLL